MRATATRIIRRQREISRHTLHMLWKWQMTDGMECEMVEQCKGKLPKSHAMRRAKNPIFLLKWLLPIDIIKAIFLFFIPPVVWQMCMWAEMMMMLIYVWCYFYASMALSTWREGRGCKEQGEVCETWKCENPQAKTLCCAFISMINSSSRCAWFNGSSQCENRDVIDRENQCSNRKRIEF